MSACEGEVREGSDCLGTMQVHCNGLRGWRASAVEQQGRVRGGDRPQGLPLLQPEFRQYPAQHTWYVMPSAPPVVQLHIVHSSASCQAFVSHL